MEFQNWTSWHGTSGDYWERAFCEPNPFKPSMRCPSCKKKAIRERSRAALEAPVTQFEFKCECGTWWNKTKRYKGDEG